jgi:hypothetical protein
MHGSRQGAGGALVDDGCQVAVIFDAIQAGGST